MTHKIIVIIIFILVLFSNITEARRALPDDNLSYPVLVKINNQPIASGFYFNNGNIAVFVTARHVLFDEPKKSNENETESKAGYSLRTNELILESYPIEISLTKPIVIKLDLKKLYQNGYVKYHNSYDVSIVKVFDVTGNTQGKGPEITNYNPIEGVTILSAEGTICSGHYGVLREYDKVKIGDDVYLFGYPSSLGFRDAPQIDYEKPLLRKGIVAGKNEKLKTIILDCPTYYGNSGGPVVEVEGEGLEVKYRIIGVVSQFIPFVDEWKNTRQGYTNIQIQNSGYSVVVPSDYIVELINTFTLLQNTTSSGNR